MRCSRPYLPEVSINHSPIRRRQTGRFPRRSGPKPAGDNFLKPAQDSIAHAFGRGQRGDFRFLAQVVVRGGELIYEVIPMPKKIKIPTHYLCYNGDGKKAVAAAKAETLKAAKQYVDYFHAEEIPADPHQRASLVYGTALRLNQTHKEILDAVEASLMVDVANNGFFSTFQTIEEWMDAHNIRHSAAAISRARTLAEIIIPWCANNQVFPGASQREVEQWFMTLSPQARTTVNRVGHVGPIIKKIIAD
jgi:hypothetical protein